jgi:dihydroflavonol-4-reductase
MKAFVTGATGLLGNNLVRELLAEGHSVRALVRSAEKAARVLGDTGAEVVAGDMEDVAAFAPALDGCDVVFHTAAYFREYYGPGDHWPKLDKINVQGTLALAEAARSRGVRRLLDTSSSGIIGLKPGGEPGDESTPPAPVARTNLYFRSKVMAEERLRAWSRTSGMETLSIFPGWMFGPHDAGPTGAGQLVNDFMARKIPAVPPGGTSIVDARDVAQGMVRAAERGRPGERYILGGTYYSLAEVLQLLGTVTGIPAPTLAIPYGVAFTIAALAETWARLTGTPTVMTVEGVRTLAAALSVSSARAQRELGATFRPFEDTLRDTVAWIRAWKQPARVAA